MITKTKLILGAAILAISAVPASALDCSAENGITGPADPVKDDGGPNPHEHCVTINDGAVSRDKLGADVKNELDGKADKITTTGNSTMTLNGHGVLVEDDDGNESGLAAEGLVVVDKDNPVSDGTVVTGKGVQTTGEVVIKGTKVKETLDGHNTRIGSLETTAIEHDRRISANADAIANHAVHLDELDKGLAIAMAMPDAWLSDKKTFGIFGSVGGFNGETAVGFAAIGRIDETWSINGKLGTDTDFDQFGWQVGAGAQW